MGCTPQIAIGVWIGLDDPGVSLGEKQYGSSAALPIFGKAIKGIYDVKGWEVENWEKPDEVEEIKICSETYNLPTRYCPLTSEIFLKKHKPKKQCSQHKSAFDRFKGKK